jgi:hypothetical protein
MSPFDLAVRRRWKASRTLFVVIVLTGLLATTLEVAPWSAAETINNVEVTQGAVEAALKPGTTSICEVTDRATFAGDADRVHQFIDAETTSATANGMTVDVGGSDPQPGFATYDVVLSYDVDLSTQNVSSSDCATSVILTPYRGRGTLQLPAWARGMIALAAGLAVYLAVVFAVTAIFAFLAPQFAYYGELLGGCVGGFASTYVANFMNGVKQAANLTNSAVQCISGAILNVSLGSVKKQMRAAIHTWLEAGNLSGAGADGVVQAAGNPSAVQGPLGQAGVELAQQLPSP